MNPTSIVIYEDNDILRESLSGLIGLTEGYEVLGRFSQWHAG
jgi:hypothetical protein